MSIINLANGVVEAYLMLIYIFFLGIVVLALLWGLSILIGRLYELWKRH